MRSGRETPEFVSKGAVGCPKLSTLERFLIALGHTLPVTRKSALPLTAWYSVPNAGVSFKIPWMWLERFWASACDGQISMVAPQSVPRLERLASLS